MATTQTYKCIINNAPIKSRTSLLASNLGNLKKDALIEVISISRLWAYFNYNNKNAYILTLYIQKLPEVVTGSITIRCLNKDTKAEITNPLTIDNISLKSYTYTAPSIANYTVVEPSRISITFTAENPDQEVIFYYKENKIYGSITISYIEKGTNTSIAPSLTNNNLELGTYSYNSIDIPGYQVSGASSKSVTLTKDAYNQTIIFEYTKILGSVFIKYVDIDTKTEIAPNEYYANLELKSYDYKAKSIDEYTVVEPSSRTVTLTVSSPTQNIVFYYKQNKIYGSITINYIDKATNTSIAPPVANNNLELGAYSYNSIDITGYKISGASSKSVTLTKEMPNQSITFEYTKNVVDDTVYVIDLKKYSISNNNTNANATTKGINQALVDAKAAGYKRVKLLEGHYAIDTSVKNPIVLSDGTKTWTHNRQGLSMQSDMELILEGTTLQMVPCEDPYYSILTISNCKNSKITGGTILGDRETHDYGMRINESGDMFESGDFDSTTGLPIVDDTKVRTKDFISVYKDWFSGKEDPIPTNFYLIPLWNTTMNTVDGGCRYIYCYDKDGNYLGFTTGVIGYIKQATLLPNTAKIKVSIRGEKRLDIVLAMTKRTLYYTYEFGSGLTVTASNSIEINGSTIKDCIGDCIYTTAPPLKVTVDNLNIIDCTLENSRRQGISFVATGENYLVKNCNIGKINGIDPQSGIDFEHYNYMKNTVIEGCKFYDNKKWDIINYNGTDIEVKECSFTGAIATTYGYSMKIHHNIFEYKNSNYVDKIFKNNCLSLTTNNNLVYDNTFKNGSTLNKGNDSKTYNNIYVNATNSVITTNGENKYYNSKITIQQNDYLDKLENNYFENCNVYSYYDSPAIIINDCMFENSSYEARCEATLSNCKFNLKDKVLMSGWKPAKSINFNSCDINAEKNLLLSNNLDATLIFNNCIFNIPRKNILKSGDTTFNNGQIKFDNQGGNERVIFNTSYRGYWYFNDCTFESKLPMSITGGKVVNPTIIGDIIIL